jgi:hypothetical protein
MTMPMKFNVYRAASQLVEVERDVGVHRTAGMINICHLLFSPSDSHPYAKVKTRPVA